MTGSETLLARHSGYQNALFEGRYYLKQVFASETTEMTKWSHEIATLQTDAEQAFSEFGVAFSEHYFKWLNVAEQFSRLCKMLSERIGTTIAQELKPDTEVWKEACRKKLEYDRYADMFYKDLFKYVNDVIRPVSKEKGINRAALLHQIKKMLNSFKTIINYSDRSTKAILSDWSGYGECFDSTAKILQMEIATTFEYLNRKLQETLLQANDEPLSTETLINLCELFGFAFKSYTAGKEIAFGCKTDLVNEYLGAMEKILQLGAYTHSAVATCTIKTWKSLIVLLRHFQNDTRITEKTREQWKEQAKLLESIMAE